MMFVFYFVVRREKQKLSVFEKIDVNSKQICRGYMTFSPNVYIGIFYISYNFKVIHRHLTFSVFGFFFSINV